MATAKKKRSERKPPPWLLSAEWGIGIDSYNWKLYRRLQSRWNVVGNYPTLRMLVAGMQERIALTDEAHPLLVTHVNAVIKASDKLTKELHKQLASIGAGLDTKPPIYAVYADSSKEKTHESDSK